MSSRVENEYALVNKLILEGNFILAHVHACSMSLKAIVVNKQTRSIVFYCPRILIN